MKKTIKTSLLSLSLATAMGVSLIQLIPPTQASEPSSARKRKEELGRKLFHDKRLSKNQTQSCATCHDPEHGYSDQRDTPAKGMVSLGDDGHSFGKRNAPTASYAQFSPPFHFDHQTGFYVGGLFLNGRAKDLAQQAGEPPLDPIEMNMPDKASIVNRLKADEHYYQEFKQLYGKNIWNNTNQAYSAITNAISEYEKLPLFAPFDSKYDRYLRGEYELTPLEDLGRTLFFSNNNVNCSTCHKLSQTSEGDKRETFSNYQYHNIGVPSNPALLSLNQLAQDYVDLGLAEHPKLKNDPAQRGKFKTPTLRNVAVTAPYMHNGVFKDLRTVILFYDKFNNPDNTINPETGKPWRKAETESTISHKQLKAQKLNDRKIDALVAFLETLTDKRYEHLLEKQKSNKQP